ncbi:MAG: Fic family protein [Polyangiaceae bacterium]|nr:Fic family protein [Polyangiaceae bacterium]
MAKSKASGKKTGKRKGGNAKPAPSPAARSSGRKKARRAEVANRSARKPARSNARGTKSPRTKRATVTKQPKRPARPAVRRSSETAKAREKARLARAKEKANAAKERKRLAREKALAAKERERLAKEKARVAKDRARLAKEKEQQRVAAAKERERIARERVRERARLAKEKANERARAAKEKANERARLAKERALRAKERERERAQAAKEKERLDKEKAKEKGRLRAERESAQQARQAQLAEERAAAKKAREVERQRQVAARAAEREAARKAREEERIRLQEERDRQREEERRAKEEERARKEKEREEFRKAKLAERERLRSEREAARRALEGKIARANRQAQRSGGLGGRGATARLYRASAIPDQSGTTRRVEAALAERHAAAMRPAPLPNEPLMLDGEELPAVPAPEEPAPPPATPPPPLADGSGTGPPAAEGQSSPPATLPAPDNVAARYASILERLARTDEEFHRAYRESFEMSWIFHDSAMEGVVYTFQELKTAIDPNIAVVPDSSLQPVCEEIRRHKAAIDHVRDLAEKKRTPITVDTIKKLFLILHPEEGDLKTVKYRKDIPQHRLYFHEYAAPDKINYKVRQIVDWLNGPEPKKIRHPVRIAARLHFDLVRVFPFAVDSGKVARLLMNLLLLRSDYPPAIIHSTERQRYYEALKGALPVIVQMVNEAIENGLQSLEKRLDEQETRKRSFGS